MTYSAEAVITEARKWSGYLEKKSMGTDAQLQDKDWNAGSNNITWFWTWLKRNGCLNLQGGAWCDGFNDFVHAVVAGVDVARESLGGFSGYTPDSANRYKKMGRWLEAGDTPKPGDQIFFIGYVSSEKRTRIYHTGIVTKVTKDRVYTIEGNTSSAPGVVENGGCVREKSYDLDYEKIAGYGRPKYKVLTGASGGSSSTGKTAGGNAYMFNVSNLVKGNRGKAVTFLQRLLLSHGYDIGSYGVDGDFGEDTEKAVAKFQKDHNIDIKYPGTVGPKTWEVLIDLE